MDRIEARRKLEEALTEYINVEYGPDQWLGDYVISASFHDMGANALPDATQLLHLGRGPYHSQRGLVDEAGDWLVDLKLEERDDAGN